MGNGKAISEIVKDLEQMKKAPKKIVSRTLSDFKSRAPSWVAQEVVKTYNIKKSEIMPAKGGASKSAGSIKATGETLDTAELVYRGRTLTPTHFKMSPREPKQSYKLTAEIQRGNKKTLGQVKKLTKKQRANIGKNFTKQATKTSSKSPIMLMHTGNAKEGGTNFIPFQRQSQRRDDIKAIKTLSMPQMVSNNEVAERINESVSTNIKKRFDHYCEMYLGE